MSLDPNLRYLAILEMIPRSPDGITVRDIMKNLMSSHLYQESDSEDAGMIRNIQRDLIKLSERYPIDCRREGRENFWFWLENSPPVLFPSIDLNTALILSLASRYLEPIMPPTSLQALKWIFRRSADRLGQAHKAVYKDGMYTWGDKVAWATTGLQRKLPFADSKIESTIYDALLNEKAIKVRYRAWNSREDQEYVISPAGLVVRNQLIYLVSKDHGDERLRHRLLHRFSSVEPAAEAFLKAEGFKAQKYVDEGHFGFKLNRQESRIQLQVRMDDQPLTGVRECPISSDQKIQPLKEDKYLLAATVDNTLELHQWLRSHAHHVEVLAPEWLREEFAESAKAMVSLYSS